MIAIKTTYPPTPQQRHRHRKVGRYVKTYDPSSEDKQNFLKSILQFKPSTPLECPIAFRVAFWCKRPQSHYGTGKNAGILKEKYRKTYMMGNFDVDNLVKFVLDGMNKVFFKDDRQIFFLEAGKYYANNPENVGIHIVIEER